MLEKGIRGEQTVVVTKELSAKEMGSGELMVYATPAMIALMEKTAYTSVASELEEGMGNRWYFDERISYSCVTDRNEDPL